MNDKTCDYSPRQYSPIDRAIQKIDQALQTIFGNPQGTGRQDPAINAQPPIVSPDKSSTETTDNTSPDNKKEQLTQNDTTAPAALTDEQRKQSAALMRINHCGEVCAQALYQGQALTARSDKVRESMQQASNEENDHLLWCNNRLNDLDGRRSYLNPLWYAGSFTLGAIAGMVGDKWSLGFVAETERQVVRHLDSHLQQITRNDYKTHAVLTQMKIDEAEHATNAVKIGAAELPGPIKSLMGLSSRIMTKTAYWI